MFSLNLERVNSKSWNNVTRWNIVGEKQEHRQSCLFVWFLYKSLVCRNWGPPPLWIYLYSDRLRQTYLVCQISCFQMGCLTFVCPSFTCWTHVPPSSLWVYSQKPASPFPKYVATSLAACFFLVHCFFVLFSVHLCVPNLKRQCVWCVAKSLHPSAGTGIYFMYLFSHTPIQEFHPRVLARLLSNVDFFLNSVQKATVMMTDFFSFCLPLDLSVWSLLYNV